MDLYKELNLTPIRSEPDVWVSRLVILERITPNPVIVRDIALARGLNIIWAEEAEDDNNPTAEITGHSAGKTTFCRLLRYALGETTFGTKAAMDLIRRALPDGYVAAELHVRGRRWAVRRPFGSGRMSYIRDDASVEELLESGGRSVTQNLYPRELGLDHLLDDLETGAIVQTGESIEWAHVLAWCTRDQEARFQNIHGWRSPRSEAETPSLDYSKSGPLFVMRAVLGLFLPDELKGEERLAELQREKARLAKEIEEKRQEPEFRVNLYDRQLRDSLKSVLPGESDIDSRPFRSTAASLFHEDLDRLTTKTLETIGRSTEDGEQQRLAIQTQIDDLGAEFRRQEEALRELETVFGLDVAAGHELDAGLSKHDAQRKKIEELSDRKCPLGDVVFRDCSYIQKRLLILQMTEIQDADAMEQAEARRAEELGKIDAEKVSLQKEIERIGRERCEASQRREKLAAYIREQSDSMRDLERTRDGLVMWLQKRDQPGGYEELDLLRGRFDSTEAEIAEVEKELAELLRQHDANRDRLAAIFSGAVRSVLSSDGYDGRVSLDNRELAFRITHGQAMSGEAVETLSVLLADVAALVYNTVSDNAHLPGFLLHDSPREADLGIRIYRSFIRFAASLQAHFRKPDNCPFQYLITTTTAPPEELHGPDYVKLRLNASAAEGLLLRCNIADRAEAASGRSLL